MGPSTRVAERFECQEIFWICFLSVRSQGLVSLAWSGTDASPTGAKIVTTHWVAAARREITVAVAAGVLWLVAAGGPVRGGIIITPANGGANIITGHSPIGQTFVAEDPHVTVGLHIDQNPGGGSRELTISMFEGMGVGGTLLDNRVVNVPQAFTRGYLDQDYSHLSLTVGQAYSVTLSSTSPAFYSDNTLASTSYANGVPIIDGVVRSDLPDKAFRVVPVPEPAGTLAVVAALAAGTLTRGRRRLL